LKSEFIAGNEPLKGISRVRGVPNLDGKDAVVSGGNVGDAEDRIGCLMSGRKEAGLEKKVADKPLI
jgi:hypothetical protein